jgi:peptide/nickel transport system substrate-binding protein
MFHNMRKTTNTLADVKVRQAIDLAIDRTALTQALGGGVATRSFFPDFSPYYSDSSSKAGDATAAGAKLDEAGWTLANGKRSKAGVDLTIKLVCYPHRPGLVIMQPVIETQLTALGITVNKVLTGMDWSETQKIMDDGDFDLLMWAQHTLPAGDPYFFMHNFFDTDGGSNHAGFKSTNADAKLDALSIVEDHAARVTASSEAMAAILAEVPVSNLVTPVWHVGVSDRMLAYEPWGADYYVIRADIKPSDKCSPRCTFLRTAVKKVPLANATPTAACLAKWSEKKAAVEETESFAAAVAFAMLALYA